jgi:hypothetical protein
MRSPETPKHAFVVGRIYARAGDVTTLASIANQPPRQLEIRIGYGEGRLKDGYSLLALVEKVAIDDFIWGDQTRYSGRWQFRRDIGEYVPRIDLFRAELAKKHNYDEAKIDAEFYEMLGKQQNGLNTREGINRIVKIAPNVPHEDALDWRDQYPNSPIGNTPQWTLSRPKKFICIANVLPGAMYRIQA